MQIEEAVESDESMIDDIEDFRRFRIQIISANGVICAKDVLDVFILD